MTLIHRNIISCAWTRKTRPHMEVNWKSAIIRNNKCALLGAASYGRYKHTPYKLDRILNFNCDAIFDTEFDQYHSGILIPQ